MSCLDPSNPAQAFPVIAPGTTVKSIELIQDEQGTTHLDNISINNQVIGGPNTPQSANDCKKGGYANLQDANGNTFKNQGQCVSSFNHQDKGNDKATTMATTAEWSHGDNGDRRNGQHGEND